MVFDGFWRFDVLDVLDDDDTGPRKMAQANDVDVRAWTEYRWSVLEKIFDCTKDYQ